MIVKNWTELTSYASYRLGTNGVNIESEELMSELYLWLIKNCDNYKKEVDYLKLSKKWIQNQCYWTTKTKLPKSSANLVKSMLKPITINSDGDLTKFEDVLIYQEDYDNRLDFALWIEEKLDKPEKILMKLYFVDGLSIKKIAEMIRSSGISISDSSIYFSIVKLRTKLRKLATIWRQL
jgi:RNA polymerase sigma factor (sigma-70 family)